MNFLNCIRNTLFFSFALACCISCGGPKYASLISQSEIELRLTDFPVNCNIRAIEAIDENTMWYTGSGGQFGYTEDGGETWIHDSIQIEDTPLEFRSIAVTDEAVFLLSIGSPALLFKSTDKGQHWQLVYQEADSSSFYNSMAFWDNQYGIAVGDPIGGCLSIILTKSNGRVWQKIDCKDLLPTVDAEYGFAASNTCVSLFGDHAWIGTGGKKARIFHSPDRGKSWEVFDTPMIQGGQMTGIFSVAFADEENGIVFGGNWEDKDWNSQNKARSRDGGHTWELIAERTHPGYRSCVQYVPNTEGIGVLAVGSPGISLSKDSGSSWESLSSESYYTIRFAPSGNMAWLAGNGRIAKMNW